MTIPRPKAHEGSPSPPPAAFPPGRSTAAIPLSRAAPPFLGSLLIEALQWAFGTGVAQIEDVLLNTLGAAIGCARFRMLRPPFAPAAPLPPDFPAWTNPTRSANSNAAIDGNGSSGTKNQNF